MGRSRAAIRLGVGARASVDINPRCCVRGRSDAWQALVIVYLLAGIALIGALIGGYMKIHHDGYEQGRLECKNEWNVANRKAEAEAAELIAEQRATAAKHVAHLDAANASATDYYSRWRESNARNRKPLVEVSCPPAVGRPDVASAAVVPADSGVQFTSEFVREWDSAWTGRTGQPVFGNTGEDASATGGTTAPAEVLANHGENATGCSANSRAHNALIDLLLKLRGD